MHHFVTEMWTWVYISVIKTMGSCKKDVTPFLTHWSFVFLALTHRNGALWDICLMHCGIHEMGLLWRPAHTVNPKRSPRLASQVSRIWVSRRKLTTVKYLIEDALNPKTQMFLVFSCSPLCPIYISQMLSREWRCWWSSADRRCSNYVWVILLPTKVQIILKVWQYVI